jgi:hypothetical protein
VDANRELGAMELATFSEAKETLSSLNAQSLSSILVSLKVHAEESKTPSTDAHGRLVELLQSPSVKALLMAANSMSREQAMTPEDALRSIVVSIKEIDTLWSHVLMKEGLARLTTQLH